MPHGIVEERARFSFRRQPDRAPVFVGSPRAIYDGIEPADAHDEEIRLRKLRMRPIAGWLVVGRVHEAAIT